MSSPMDAMNTSKSLDEILLQLTTYLKRQMGGRQVGGGELSPAEAKQAIVEAVGGLIKEVFSNPDNYGNYREAMLQAIKEWQ